MDKWILVPDVHFPVHDKRKVSIVTKIMNDWQPDYITLLGDLDHMNAPSRWVSGTPEEWKERVAVTTETTTKKWLRELREDHPDAEIVYLEGNHELRLREYIAKNAPALDGLVTMPKILDLDNLGIEYHEYGKPPRKMYAGHYAHHGSYVSKHASESAKKELLAYGVSGFSGHTHRFGEYHKTYLDGRQLSWYECGHLSDPKKQDYNQHHNWQAGFMYAYIHNKKLFPFQAKFDGNVVVFDGIKYS